MTRLPGWFACTLTGDSGTEMARHARITDETGIRVNCAGPHAPWQRGSNENINGLLREYLRKSYKLRNFHMKSEITRDHAAARGRAPRAGSRTVPTDTTRHLGLNDFGTMPGGAVGPVLMPGTRSEPS